MVVLLELPSFLLIICHWNHSQPGFSNLYLPLLLPLLYQEPLLKDVHLQLIFATGIPLFNHAISTIHFLSAAMDVYAHPFGPKSRFGQSYLGQLCLPKCLEMFAARKRHLETIFLQNIHDLPINTSNNKKRRQKRKKKNC